MGFSGSAVKDFAEAPLGRLLFKCSWPALIAMSLNALYAVVDRTFIGYGCGVDSIAGLTLAMPIVMLFGAVGVLIGAGHSATLSVKLGAGDRVACEKLVGQLVAFKLLFFLTIVPLVYWQLDWILGLCGADRVTPQACSEARTYLRIVLFAHIFSHLSFGLSAMQRAEGSPVRSMFCMVVGFGLNLILDPIFIFGFRMGIAGAAWATNIAMFCSCLWALSGYWRKRTIVRFRLRRIGFYPNLLVKPLGIGLAPFLQQLMSSVIAAALTATFTRWMPDVASRTAQIASVGVFYAVLILVMMPIMGAQQGLQPIIGYNWGARNFDRVRRILLLGLGVTTVLTFIAWVVQVVPPFPRLMARLFISADKAAMVDLAAHDLQLSNCMIWCISINLVSSTYFQSVGKPMTAIVLSLLRQCVFLLPVIMFLPYFMDDKPLAIWLSMPISDVACCLFSCVPLWLHTRFLFRLHKRVDVRREKYDLAGSNQ